MRGGWFGRGYGMGRGRGAYAWPGNPYPYCRNFPWLPRGWWRTGVYGSYPGWTDYSRAPNYGGYRTYPYPVAPYQTEQV